MKYLWAFLILAGTCFGQSTSLSTIPIPGPIPTWGGYAGVGTVVTPTDFNAPICRVTDGNTEFNFDHTLPGANFGANFSGANVDHRWNSNHTLLAVARVGDSSSLVQQIIFNGTSCTVASVYKIPSKDVAFSSQPTHPLIAYTVEVGAIKKYDFGEGLGCTLSAPCVTVIHDFATGTCINGLNPSWNSSFLDSHLDQFFAIGFSNHQLTGGQGTGTIVATYLIGSGERVLNTGGAAVLGIPASTVCGDYGPTGVVSMVGSNCPAAGSGACGTCTGGVVCPDQTTIHEVYASPNDATPWLVYDLGAAALCTNCGGDSDWIWAVKTLNVTSPSWGGHYALGYNHIIIATNNPVVGENAIFQAIDNSGNLIFPITKLNITSTSGPNNLPSPGVSNMDNHIAWQNVDPNDSFSPFITTTVYRTDTVDLVNNYVASGEPPSAMPGIQCVGVGCTPLTQPMTGPFVNELLSPPLTNPPGNGVPCSTSPCTTLPQVRWAHEFNDTVTFLFNAQNSIGALSPDGAMFAFSTTAFCGFGDSTNDANIICGGPTWKASNSTYVVGNIISPLTANNGNFTYKIVSCAGPCASGAVHPTWTQTTGANVTDNTITWQSVGPQNAREDVLVVLLVPPSNTKQFPAPPKQLIAEESPWLRRRARYGI